MRRTEVGEAVLTQVKIAIGPFSRLGSRVYGGLQR